MRALSAELLAEQQAASNTPYVAVTIGAYKYDTDGQATYTNRVLAIHRWEEVYGGGLEIWLDNADKGLNGINFVGQAVTLLRGFKASGGTVYTSQTQPYTVILQRDDSIHDKEPQLVVHLTCADNWYKLANDSLIAAGVKVIATNASSITQGTGWVKGEVITGTPSGGTGNLVAVGTDFIVLVNCQASDFTGDTSFAGASGSISSVSSITDQSAVAGGEYKGIALATYPADTGIINLITSGIIADVVIDSDDPDGQLATTPYVPVALGESVRGVVFRLLQMTRCGARIDKDNKLRLFYLDPSGTVDDNSTYSTTHIYWSTARERSLLIPNTVDFVESSPDVNSVPAYYGTANDTTSVALIGSYLYPLQVNPSISSNAMATILATAFIARKVAESFQGYISVPINVGQEVYDMVQVVDARSGLTLTARVGRVEEWYNGDVMGPARYETQLRLGSLMSEPGEIGLPGSSTSDMQDVVNPQPKLSSELTPDILPWNLDKALLPIVIDTTFTAVDNDDISWTAGTITFADKATQVIDAGSLNLANANAYYLYALIGTTALQNTQTFGTSVGPDRVLIAFVKKAPETNQKAMIVPAKGGKSPLLNEDNISANCITASEIYVSQLSAIAADMGLLTAGEIRVGSGTVGEDFTGFRIDTDYIAGYNDDVLQAYIASADGKLYAGGGHIILDADGILVSSPDGTQYLQFYRSGGGGGTVGYVYSRAADEIALTAAADKYVVLDGLEIRCVGDVVPYTNEGYDLGAVGKRWADVWANSFKTSQDGTDFATIYADVDGGLCLSPDVTSGVIYALGTLDMGNNPISGLGNAYNFIQGVANNIGCYVANDAISNFVLLMHLVHGDTPYLDMDAHKITNVPTPTNPLDVPNMAFVEGQNFAISASNNIKFSNDTGKNTTSTSPVEVKGILVKQYMDAVRVFFHMKNQGAGGDVACALYKNDVLLDEWKYLSGAGVESDYTYDATSLVPDDELQIWGYVAGAGDCLITNFRLGFDIAADATAQDP